MTTQTINSFWCLIITISRHSKERIILTTFVFRRSDSALQDGSDNNVNLTGGYYDAG